MFSPSEPSASPLWEMQSLALLYTQDRCKHAIAWSWCTNKLILPCDILTSERLRWGRGASDNVLKPKSRVAAASSLIATPALHMKQLWWGQIYQTFTSATQHLSYFQLRCSSSSAAAHHLNEIVKACKKKKPCLPSHRDKDVEDADHDAPFAPSKEIAYDGRSDGGIAGFSGPDQASQQGQKPELLHRQKHQRYSTCFLSTAHGYTHGESPAESQIRYKQTSDTFSTKTWENDLRPHWVSQLPLPETLNLRLSKLQLNVMQESLPPSGCS